MTQYTVEIKRCDYDPLSIWFHLYDNTGRELFSAPRLWPNSTTPRAARRWARSRIKHDLDKKPGQVLYRGVIDA